MAKIPVAKARKAAPERKGTARHLPKAVVEEIADSFDEELELELDDDRMAGIVDDLASNHADGRMVARLM